MASSKSDLDNLVRDLDLLVFKLEQGPPASAPDLLSERGQIHRELERVRDQLDEVTRML
ncbi:MAG: hypothetical protein JXX28_18705 [Deltaproteobacteria bacterium]|nr:hypothetical protein [Deltaproteobacteria bacterium]